MPGVGSNGRIAVVASIGMLWANEAMAEKQISIGSVSGGNQGTSILTTFLQTWVNFATGPWAVAVIALSILIGLAVWVFMPREGPLGWIGRGIIAGLIALNLGTWMSDLGYSGK